MPPRVYKDRYQEWFSMTDLVTNKGSKSGKRSQISPITLTDKENWNLPSGNKDKRKGTSQPKSSHSPFTVINHCIMTTLLKHAFNNIIQTSDLIATRSTHTLLEIQQSLKAIPRDDDHWLDTPPELITNMNNKRQEQLKGVLMVNLQESLNNSPTNTEPLHSRYPFWEHTDNNNDLSEQHYSCPYLAIKVNSTIRDSCIVGKEHMTSARYDEGSLKAQPMMIVEEDFEDQVGCYPFRENAYLDLNIL